MLIPLLLTGCCADAPPVNPSWEIYAPDSLVLRAGRPVPTADGTYTPKQDEMWHSNRRMQEARELILDATRAMESRRNSNSEQ